MAFTQSAIFMAVTRDALIRTTSFTVDLDADSFKCALYNNSITPDNTVTAANSAYAVGQWTVANEVTDSTNWVAGGRALASVTVSAASGINYVMFDATDTAGGGNVTLASVYGDLVYDDTVTAPVADQGLAYHYFGGSQGVTAGTFCSDSSTEIMTRRGWLTYDQVRPGQDECLTLDTATGAEEWQAVKAVHIFPDGPHDVIRMEGPGHTSVSTPDHRWPAVVPGQPGIRWYTTATLPGDAQLLISEDERTGKVKDLTRTQETADVVWCPETPNGTWYARHNTTTYHTGNTVMWHANGVARWTHTAA